MKRTLLCVMCVTPLLCCCASTKQAATGEGQGAVDSARNRPPFFGSERDSRNPQKVVNW